MVGIKGSCQTRQVGGSFALRGRHVVILRKSVLAVVMHQAVVVFIPNQHAVLPTNPAGGIEQTVAVDVHHHIAVVERAVVVEVYDDR